MLIKFEEENYSLHSVQVSVDIKQTKKEKLLSGSQLLFKFVFHLEQLQEVYVLSHDDEILHVISMQK